MLISGPCEGLCLAYANTRFWRGRAQPTETLAGLADLLGWLERTAGVDPTAKRGIVRWARDHPRQAAQVFADAMALREALYAIFSAVAAAEPPRQPEFGLLQRALVEAPSRSRLVHVVAGGAWQTAHAKPSASHLLAPVLWSAGDLIAKGARATVRRCANDACLWLFLDASRNATRRWCDMASCGNRDKARRHYQRSKTLAE